MNFLVTCPDGSFDHELEKEYGDISGMLEAAKFQARVADQPVQFQYRGSAFIVDAATSLCPLREAHLRRPENAPPLTAIPVLPVWRALQIDIG